MNHDETLPDFPLKGLTADSRKVEPGYLFAAIPGTKQDGSTYIKDAVARGAVAVLAPPGVDTAAIGADVTLITDSNPRRRLARMAARFYAPQPDVIVAVTGTNGKTSTASFARQLWDNISKPAASIGTLGIVGGGYEGGGGLTTPDPVDLHRTLNELKRKGVDHIAMEASSHGLDQYRLDGVSFSAAALTNITRDHLDYHGTMESYRTAKLRLFEDLLIPGGAAIANTACAEFDLVANIANERRLRLIGYGLDRGQIRCQSISAVQNGFLLILDILGDRFEVDFPLPGRFQIENALCALALLIGSGEDPATVAPQLSRLTGVRGRMERAGATPEGAAVYVDYAHTPDALETVLKNLRPHVPGKLHVVFGCGGDRDRGKRPMMGKIAAEYADCAIVTDDNPRSEKPEAIRAEVMEGCPEAKNIGSRHDAIFAAVKNLKAGDALVVAGKGHEQGQTIGDQVLPFDDVSVVREALAAIGGIVE